MGSDEKFNVIRSAYGVTISMIGLGQYNWRFIGRGLNNWATWADASKPRRPTSDVDY